METQFNPVIMLSSLITSWIMTWAYKHPGLTWINKGSIKSISFAIQSVVTAVVLWASGDLTAETTQAAVQSVLEVVYHAVISSGLGTAFHEWTKKSAATPPT